TSVLRSSFGSCDRSCLRAYYHGRVRREATEAARGREFRSPLGTTPSLGELRNVGIVFQKQHAVDVKDFGNLLAPRQGHGRRGEIVDRRYQVDRLGGISGRIERLPLA